MTNQPASPHGLLFVLSAPSGGGKDSVLRGLQKLGVPLQVSVSVTTRPPRPGEVNGVDYYFISQAEYDTLVAQDALLEHAVVHGNSYGVPRQPVREWLAAGKDVLLKIDVQGAATIRKKVPHAIFIFLAPESVEALVKRLHSRDTETAADLALRVADASHELAQQDWYDYCVINRQNHLDEAVEQVRAIIVAEHCRVRQHHAEV
jgi:guanylate kinase